VPPRTAQRPIEQRELESSLARSGVSGSRERSGAFGLSARVGERVADERPGQRAKRSDGAKKANEGAPIGERSLGGFAALGGGARESRRVSAEGASLPLAPSGYSVIPNQKKAGGLFDRQPGISSPAGFGLSGNPLVGADCQKAQQQQVVAAETGRVSPVVIGCRRPFAGASHAGRPGLSFPGHCCRDPRV